MEGTYRNKEIGRDFELGSNILFKLSIKDRYQSCKLYGSVYKLHTDKYGTALTCRIIAS